ncbi:MAG: Rrf2 family transcriptional regulator [Nitrospirae bacterium]|nr:MAG: Rrf2 family transcriptional regulator [Nitrospirota bacterium]
MQITRETDYAIRCVLYLSTVKDAVIMMEEISAKMDIPKSFLAKILQKLARRGIVKSFRGVKGGFQLAHNPSQINLADVIEAIQGPLFMNKCIVDAKVCSRTGSCSVHPLWRGITDKVVDILRKQNFKKLAEASALPCDVRGKGAGHSHSRAVFLRKRG